MLDTMGEIGIQIVVSPCAQLHVDYTQLICRNT